MSVGEANSGCRCGRRKRRTRLRWRIVVDVHLYIKHGSSQRVVNLMMLYRPRKYSYVSRFNPDIVRPVLDAMMRRQSMPVRVRMCWSGDSLIMMQSYWRRRYVNMRQRERLRCARRSRSCWWRRREVYPKILVVKFWMCSLVLFERLLGCDGNLVVSVKR